MRVRSLLHRFLTPRLEEVHAKRVAAVLAVVDGLISGGRLTAVGLGRSLGDHVAHKHSIKRVDRLLGNWQLHAEVTVFCRAVAWLLLRGQRRPVILADWTDLGIDQVALVAAVPVGGRALPIYFEIHPLPLLGNGKVERNFLRVLKEKVVPPECSPSVVTDAGFKNPWFKTVEELGWDFVGRLVPNVIVSARLDATSKSVHADHALKVRELFADASETPDDLGERLVAASNPIVARVVRYKKLPKGRRGARKGNRKRVHPGSRSYKKCQKRGKEPWLLATSVRDGTPSQIAGLYSRRMEIEELFRDEKSHRFGWSLEDASSRHRERLRVLLLIACIGLLAQILVGIVAEQTGLHRQYQANTEKARRVLSCFVLGRLILSGRNANTLLARMKSVSFAPLRARVAVYRGPEP